MSNIIYITNAVLSFPKLVEATSNSDYPNAPKKFSADLIMQTNSPEFAKFMQEVGQLATEKWKDKAGPILQMIQSDRRLRCFGNGAEKLKKDTMKPYEGYDGMVYIAASSNEDRPPIIVNPQDGKEIDNANTLARSAAARKLYGGCRVNAAIRPWLQDNQFGRGVRCELIAVQFFQDGTPFGEAPPDIGGMFGAVPAAQQQPAASPAAAAFPAFFGNS